MLGGRPCDPGLFDTRGAHHVCWGSETRLAKDVQSHLLGPEGIWCPEARLDRERRYGVREGSRKIMEG